MIETAAPLPALRHFGRLSDAVGIFEHAKLDCPRPECGYCTGPTPGDCSPSRPGWPGMPTRPPS